MRLGSGINDLPIVTDWRDGNEWLFLVQNRLNSRFYEHPFYPLQPDGFWSDEWCYVALLFQKEKLGIDSPTLTPRFFQALDTSGDLAKEYGPNLDPNKEKVPGSPSPMSVGCEYMYGVAQPPVPARPGACPSPSWKAVAIGAGAVALGLGVALLLAKGGKKGKLRG